MAGKTLLSDPQRRSLSVTSKRVERTANDLIELLLQQSSSTLCDKITKSFSKEERIQYERLLKELKQLNEQMFHALHLEASTTDERQILSAKLVNLWTILEDSRSKKMKRYGEMKEDCAKEIDFYVEKLLEVLEKAIRL